MADSKDVKALAEIRAGVEGACNLLLAPSPAAVDRCAEVIGSAISSLGEWRRLGQDNTAGRPVMEEALRLSTTVRRAGRLLESAAAYYAGWRQALGSLCAGYTASGAAAATAPPGRLCLRG